MNRPWLVENRPQCPECGGSGFTEQHFLFWHWRKICPFRQNMFTHREYHGYVWPWGSSYTNE
jgi:hypothetical protein